MQEPSPPIVALLRAVGDLLRSVAVAAAFIVAVGTAAWFFGSVLGGYRLSWLGPHDLSWIESVGAVGVIAVVVAYISEVVARAGGGRGV